MNTIVFPINKLFEKIYTQDDNGRKVNIFLKTMPDGQEFVVHHGTKFGVYFLNNALLS